VTQDIVCNTASGPTAGFSFQLNCYSPLKWYSAWQQYVFALFGSELLGAVDNWPLAGPTGNIVPNIINDFFNLLALPNAVLPAGYQLKIVLLNVTGATYIVIDSQGTTRVNVTQLLQPISTLASSATAPSLAVFNGQLFVAFIANNSSRSVLACSTADGANWNAYTTLAQSSSLSPSLAVFNGLLYVAFLANNATNSVLVSSTFDGANWTNNTNINQSSKFAPSLAAFKNRLYVAFIANNGGNAVLVASSADGLSWTNNMSINQSSAGAPSLAVFNGRLYVAFIANNASHTLLVASSADGANWTNNTNINQSSKFGPSLAFFNNRLYVAFIANNPSNSVLVCSSADGVTWTNNTNINQSSDFAPSLAVFNNHLYVSFLANNPSKNVLTCSSADGVTWTNNSQINPDLAPIIAFELNLVGPVNGESAILSSGAGTFSYTASNALTAVMAEPPCAESGYVTAETANSFYTAMSANPSTSITQSFSVDFAKPAINKIGKHRPGLIYTPPAK
jgi:hypothetical protein